MEYICVKSLIYEFFTAYDLSELLEGTKEKRYKIKNIKRCYPVKDNKNSSTEYNE